MTKTAVVTGGTSGLGEAAALALAEAGWRVLIVGRDAERGAAVEQTARKSAGTVELLLGDLMSLSDVHRLAGEIRARAPRLDLLIHNAGGTFGPRRLTEDGLERTFALNVAAPFALTEALLEPLAAARGRVVNVVTGVPKGAKATLAQLHGDASSAGMGSYLRSKLALQALTREQQRRYGARGITFVSLHPGVIPNTRFGGEMPAFLRAIGPVIAYVFRFGSTLDEAAARYMKVGTGPVEPGAFYSKGELDEPAMQAKDEAFARALWSLLEGIAAARARAVVPVHA